VIEAQHCLYRMNDLLGYEPPFIATPEEILGGFDE